MNDHTDHARTTGYYDEDCGVKPSALDSATGIVRCAAICLTIWGLLWLVREMIW